MGWTYDSTVTTDRDRLRLLIGDTNESDQQLQDEELDLFLSLESDYQHAAKLALRAIIARYSRYVDKWVGDLKILASQRVKHYTDLLAQVQISISGTFTGYPTAGGIYQSEKDTAAADTSLVQPYFRRGMLDNEGSGTGGE